MTAPRSNTAAELAALRATFEAFMDHQQAAQAEAKAVRATILGGMDEIKDKATNVHHRVSKLETDMKAVKPVIAKVNGWQSMVLGGAIVLSLLGGAVSLFWQAVREKIIATFGG